MMGGGGGLRYVQIVCDGVCKRALCITVLESTREQGALDVV